MAFTEVDVLNARDKMISGASSKSAIKIKDISDKSQKSLAIRNLVRREGHKYFPEFYACWQDSNFIFFLMEYLPGGDLMKHLIDKEIFPEKTARFYAAQIVRIGRSVLLCVYVVFCFVCAFLCVRQCVRLCELSDQAISIGFMHDHLHYVHRDVKPDNVLFDSKGHSKLVDFGLSRLLPISSKVGLLNFPETFQSAVGTPDYMAPEVHRPGHAHDRTIDWWSVSHHIQTKPKQTHTKYTHPTARDNPLRNAFRRAAFE